MSDIAKCIQKNDGDASVVNQTSSGYTVAKAVLDEANHEKYDGATLEEESDEDIKDNVTSEAGDSYTSDLPVSSVMIQENEEQGRHERGPMRSEYAHYERFKGDDTYYEDAVKDWSLNVLEKSCSFSWELSRIIVAGFIWSGNDYIHCMTSTLSGVRQGMDMGGPVLALSRGWDSGKRAVLEGSEKPAIVRRLLNEPVHGQ